MVDWTDWSLFCLAALVGMALPPATENALIKLYQRFKNRPVSQPPPRKQPRHVVGGGGAAMRIFKAVANEKINPSGYIDPNAPEPGHGDPPISPATGEGEVTIYMGGGSMEKVEKAWLNWIHGNEPISSGKRLWVVRFPDEQKYIIIGADCETPSHPQPGPDLPDPDSGGILPDWLGD